MYRKRVITGLAALLFMGMSAQVQAQTTFVEDVVARIEAEGYVVTKIGRSLLGRIVITANNDIDLREIVLNRTSGDVLRDQRFSNEETGRDTARQKGEAPDDQGKSGDADDQGGSGHGGSSQGGSGQGGSGQGGSGQGGD